MSLIYWKMNIQSDHEAMFKRFCYGAELLGLDPVYRFTILATGLMPTGYVK